MHDTCYPNLTTYPSNSCYIDNVVTQFLPSLVNIYPVYTKNHVSGTDTPRFPNLSKVSGFLSCQIKFNFLLLAQAENTVS